MADEQSRASIYDWQKEPAGLDRDTFTEELRTWTARLVGSTQILLESNDMVSRIHARRTLDGFREWVALWEMVA